MKKWMRAYRVPVLVLLFLGGGILSWQTIRVHAAGATLSLTPSSQTVTQGSSFSVTIHEDSGASSVNAIQVKLTYPTDKLTFKDINYTGSSFDVHASQSGGSGLVKLSVGKTPPAATGDKVVAVVNFQATDTGSANVGFGCNFNYSNCTDGNAVITSTDNTDILATSTGAIVTIGGGLTNSIPSGQTLNSGQSLISKNVMNTLVMQTDGNVVLYGSGRPLWWTGTGGSGAAKLVMQSDGNLVLYRNDGSPVWWNGAGGRGASNAVLQDDGNFVTYVTSSGVPTWFTGTGGHYAPEYFGSDRLNSDQTLNVNQYIKAQDGKSAIVLNPDGSLALYAAGYRVVWNNGTAGSGATKLVMQTDGNLVLYRANGSPAWWSGTGGNNNAKAILQNDGNFVIYSSTNVPVWFTGTGGKI